VKRSFFIALIVFVCCIQVSAGSESGKASIEINLPSRTLSLYKDGILFKEYPVCVGKRSTPTPQGEYRVIYKTENPYWINEGDVIPPGPQNPLGVRWIGITKSIGIHGNNRPESIGTYASSGCIRMYNRDVVELYNMVAVSTPVSIIYDRIKVFEDKYSGEKAVIIYPDSYKVDDLDEWQLQEKLEEMDIPEGSIKTTQEILKRTTGKPVAVSQGIGIFLNGSPVTCDSIEEQEGIYVNYMAAEDMFGLTAEIAGSFDIGIKELDGVIYVNLSQVVKQFGGSISYDKAVRNAYINMKIIKINGVFAGLNLGDYDKADLLDISAVKQLGYEYSEDSVDVRLFDKGIMKLDRNKVQCVDVDNIIEVLGGYKSMNSCYGAVDIRLPTFLRSGQEYYRTDFLDGRLVLNAGAAYDICEEAGWVQEAFLAQMEEPDENIDLETFLGNYDYNSNIFRTVIDIKSKESQPVEE